MGGKSPIGANNLVSHAITAGGEPRLPSPSRTMIWLWWRR